MVTMFHMYSEQPAETAETASSCDQTICFCHHILRRALLFVSDIIWYIHIKFKVRNIYLFIYLLFFKIFIVEVLHMPFSSPTDPY